MEAKNTQKTARVIGTPFKPGNKGKPKGAVNHLTRTVKETVLDVFNKIQGDRNNNLEAFAKKYPRDFYAIAAKLIPMDIKAKVETEAVKINLLFPDAEPDPS